MAKQCSGVCRLPATEKNGVEKKLGSGHGAAAERK